MQREYLTEKEHRTLRGLITYPSLNDRKLASKLKLKLSTVTAIRRRLDEKGYYQSVNVPNLYRLGFELISVEFGELSQTVSDKTMKNVLKKALLKDPNVIYALADRSHFLILSVMKNYTEAKCHHEDLHILLNEKGMFEGEVLEQVIFSFEISKFLNFFNYIPLLNYIDGTETTEIMPQPFDVTKSRAKLTKKERALLYGLVKFPTESDNNLANRYKVARQTVSSIRKKFEREGLISTTRILDPELLECDLIVFAHTTLGPMFPILEKQKENPFALRTAPVIMNVSGNFENALIGMVKSYTDFERLKREILSYYKPQLRITRSPNVILFPYKGLIYHKPLSFHQLIDQSPKT